MLRTRAAIPPNPQKLWVRVQEQLFPKSVHTALPNCNSIHIRSFARPSRIASQITLITRAVFHNPAPYRGPEIVVTLASHILKPEIVVTLASHILKPEIVVTLATHILNCYRKHEFREP
jgi:hypothetical protein